MTRGKPVVEPVAHGRPVHRSAHSGDGVGGIQGEVGKFGAGEDEEDNLWGEKGELRVES